MRTTILTFVGLLILVLGLLFGLRTLKGGQAEPLPPAPHVPTVNNNTPTLPPPTQEVFNYLIENTDYIDYIYINHPFTMAVSELPSVKGNVAYLTNIPAPNLRQCQPIANIFYKGNQEILRRANLYFSDNCKYIEILGKDNMPEFACEISENGQKYLTNMLSQVKGGPNQ